MPPPPASTPVAKNRGWVRLLIVFVVAFDVAAFFQWADGAFQSEFGGHPDEASHYLSGMRLRDAAMDHRFTALRHTSAFDVAQGGWMLAFGTSRIAVLLFMAALAAATALLIFSTVRREFGEWAAVVAATLWLCAPAVRESYETILPGLLGAFVFSGVALLGARLLDAAGPRFTAIGKWIGTAAVIGGGCVLLIAIEVTFMNRPGDPQAALLFLKECAFVLGIAAAVFALAGLVIRRRSEARTSVLWVALAALVAGVLFARWMKAGIPDVRLLVVATPALAILATRGAVALAGIVGSSNTAIGEQSRRKALWLLLLLLLSLPPHLLTGRQKDWEGFGPIAITLIEQAHGAERVLVVSDPRGEGILISEIAMRDRARQITIERGSETLVESPSPDARPRERFLEDEQLLAHLAAGSIRYIVLDSSVPGTIHAGYHDQALRVLEGNVRNFWPIYESPVVRDGDLQGHPLRIFRVLPSNGMQLQPP